MATFFDYFKVTMDYLKTNKWLLLWAFAGFSGAGYQTYEVSVKEEEKNKAIHEVAAGFQQIKEVELPVEKPNQCKECLKKVEELREEFH